MSEGGVHREPFAFEVRRGEAIRGDVWRPDRPCTGAAIVVLHGFKGFKDWGFFPWACARLAERTGHPVVCFNFTGAGVRHAVDAFDDLEAFARDTFSRALEDLEAVMDRMADDRDDDVPIPAVRRFGLLGHSRGGAVAVLKTALRAQVRALVTWAGLASVARYAEQFGESLEREGIVHIPNVRTGQMMPLRRHVLDDIRAHADRLDPVAAARRVAVPFLLVHGDADESVPLADGRALAEAGGGRLEVLAGAGHTFAAGHPFAGPTPDLERALGLSADHFRAHLGER